MMIYVEIYDISLAARLEPHQATEEGTSAMCLLDHVSSSLGTKMCPAKHPRQLNFDLEPRKVASGNYMKLWPWIMANRKTLLLIGQSKYSKCMLHAHIYIYIYQLLCLTTTRYDPVLVRVCDTADTVPATATCPSQLRHPESQRTSWHCE